jgi:hypothetical protein
VGIDQDINLDKAAMIKRSLEELFSCFENLEQQLKGDGQLSQPGVDPPEIATAEAEPTEGNESVWDFGA